MQVTALPCKPYPKQHPMEEKANRGGPLLFSSDGKEIIGDDLSKIDCHTRQNPAYRAASKKETL